MNNLSIPPYTAVSLSSLAITLDNEHYDVIEKLCQGALKNVNKLQELEIQRPASQYIILCNDLTVEIQKFIKDRKEYFIPYINELQEKRSNDHDCGTCSGKCHLQHDTKLAELTSSYIHIKDILYRLQMMSLPLHAETMYPDVYKLLRNQMVLLENSLTDLLFIEETYLLPKIIEAQKKINAKH